MHVDLFFSLQSLGPPRCLINLQWANLEFQDWADSACLTGIQSYTHALLLMTGQKINFSNRFHLLDGHENQLRERTCKPFTEKIIFVSFTWFLWKKKKSPVRLVKILRQKCKQSPFYSSAIIQITEYEKQSSWVDKSLMGSHCVLKQYFNVFYNWKQRKED